MGGRERGEKEGLISDGVWLNALTIGCSKKVHEVPEKFTKIEKKGTMLTVREPHCFGWTCQVNKVGTNCEKAPINFPGFSATRSSCL